MVVWWVSQKHQWCTPLYTEPKGREVLCKQLQEHDEWGNGHIGEWSGDIQSSVDNRATWTLGPNANDQFAVVLVVCLWKYPIEQTRSQTTEIEEKFPSLVTTWEFVSRVVRSMVERVGKTWGCSCNCLTMSLPDISLQNSPVPNVTRGVSLLAIIMLTPQLKHQDCQIDTLETRSHIPSGNMVSTLWGQTTLDHNVPSN